jgi:hypothetical protein
MRRHARLALKHRAARPCRSTRLKRCHRPASFTSKWTTSFRSLPHWPQRASHSIGHRETSAGCGEKSGCMILQATRSACFTPERTGVFHRGEQKAPNPPSRGSEAPARPLAGTQACGCQLAGPRGGRRTGLPRSDYAVTFPAASSLTAAVVSGLPAIPQSPLRTS